MKNKLLQYCFDPVIHIFINFDSFPVTLQKHFSLYEKLGEES